MNWDYTAVSDFYDKRVDYSFDCIQILLNLAKPSLVCDIGAGTGKLANMLTINNAKVVAIEPNQSMLNLGKAKNNILIDWQNYSAEDTHQSNNNFDLVTFGSSLNVTDISKSMPEALRILKPDGFFACLWNHRFLADDTQSRIESIIKSELPNFQYGSRRQDHSELLRQYLKNIIKLECEFEATQTKEDCVLAWRSHLTLKNQAGNDFDKIINKISDALPDAFTTNYSTVMWIGRK